MISAMREKPKTPRMRIFILIIALFFFAIDISGCSQQSEGPAVSKKPQGHKTIGVPAHKMPRNAKHRASYGEHFNKALQLAMQQKYDEAIKEYKLHLKAHPGSAAAYNNIGFAYYDKKDMDKAIENHRKALEISPSLVNGYFGLALAYEKKGDTKKALTNWQEFTKRADPKSKWHIKAMRHIKELTKNKKQKTH